MQDINSWNPSVVTGILEKSLENFLDTSTLGFYLTFQKWFVNFPNKNNRKIYLKCRLSWLGKKENCSLYIA